MNRPGLVTLRKAVDAELHQIVNLLQFYNYDISEWIPIRFGPDGLIPLRPKLEYLRASSTIPYLILCDGHVAGFVVVDDEVSADGAVFNMGYLFVARQYKGQGVGRSAVAQVFSRLPGRWQVWHPKENLGARQFWTKVLPPLAASPLEASDGDIDGGPATLYQFDVAPNPAPLDRRA